MIRLYLLAAATAMVAGCGTIDCDDSTYTCTGDDRPATLEYVTSTVLRPYCATAACHSAFAFVGTGDSHYRFDTYEHARDSILHPVPSDPLSAPIVDTETCSTESGASFLFSVLIRETGPNGESPRMPYDQALSTPDIALVKRWIESGLDGIPNNCPPGQATP